YLTSDYSGKNYNSNETAYLECATDNAVRRSTTDMVVQFAKGELTTNNQAFVRDFWKRDYDAMFLLNLFLKDNRGLNSRVLIKPELNTIVVRRLQGEAYGLRAWAERDLLKKFGGKELNGDRILGFPIVTEPLDAFNEINVERNTYDECVAQIIRDCDSALKYLPLAHRDYMYDAAYLADKKDFLGAVNWNRVDGVTMYAIKAMTYLSWASKRFNPDNDIARWDSAAKYAAKVMNFKTTRDGYNPANKTDFNDPYDRSIVWSTRVIENDITMEQIFFPAGANGNGFGGSGDIGATREFMDAFGDANGNPITSSAIYDPAKPFDNREPRFYSIFNYNTRTYTPAGKSTPIYTFETWEPDAQGLNGGKDRAGAGNNVRTNIYIKKLCYGVDWKTSNFSKRPRSRFNIRYAHMALAFAEAANQLVGPNGTIYGYSPKAVIAQIRTQKTYDNQNGIPAADPYLNSVAAAGKDAFYELIKNERRIELCFEGERFHDMSRWTNDTEFNNLYNKPVHGIKTTKNGNVYTYDLNWEVENRNYNSAYMPIPYAEILRMSKMVQNQGWDQWK
ncbi:MAG TPA: RagB/SusD family nutrient uptake outer membrane protein, partial [Bacteroidales bacterium]|nr:RagB/SusD family nutrient uptake outer membrane protein [Bacteroidales bacterium]